MPRFPVIIMVPIVYQKAAGIDAKFVPSTFLSARNNPVAKIFVRMMSEKIKKPISDAIDPSVLMTLEPCECFELLEIA